MRTNKTPGTQLTEQCAAAEAECPVCFVGFEPDEQALHCSHCEKFLHRSCVRGSLCSTVEHDDRQFKSPCACAQPLENLDEVLSLCDNEGQVCDHDKACEAHYDVSTRAHVLACCTPDCLNIFEPSDIATDGTMECGICNKSYCLACKTSHPGEICKGALAQISDPLLRKMLEDGVFVKCLHCGIAVHKFEACNHVTCAACKKEFLITKKGTRPGRAPTGATLMMRSINRTLDLKPVLLLLGND